MHILSIVALLTLLAAPARADDPQCPRLQGLNVEAKVKEYCENFTPYNKAKEVAKAQQSCAKFYRAVIHIVQHVCNYLDETDKFNANDVALLSELDKSRGQTSTQNTAAVVNSRARALSRKWWIKTMADLHNLDPLYQDYMLHGLLPLTRLGVTLLDEEVMGNTCGRPGSPLSLNLLGLSGLSTAEARKTYEQIGPTLNRLSDKLMRNSNNFGNTAAQLHAIVSRASDISGLPGTPDISETAKEVEMEAVEGDLKRGAAIGASAARAEGHIDGMLKFEGGRLISKPAAAIAGSASVLVDVGLRWIEHHKLDSTSKIFIGARMAVAGMGAVGALPSGGVGLFVAAAIDAGLCWMEGIVRAGERRELEARLRTYLPFTRKVAQPDSLSADVSRQWHSAFRTDFTNVNPASGQMRSRPAGMVTESCH